MSEKGRLASIDVLRGIAVLAVVLTHLPYSTALSRSADAAGSTAALAPSVAQWFLYGQYGVHLFLVLSGFCIHLRWVRSGATDAKIDFVPFWKRRLHRLYPPYFLALLGSLAALFVFHGVLFGGRHRGLAASFGYSSSGQLAIDLVLLLLLMQNVNHASDRVGNGPFWSLALEEQLYMLYFPLLWLRVRVGWLGTLLVTLATSVLWRAGINHFHPTPSIAWSLLGPGRWFEWTLGALAVEAYYDRATIPAWVRHPAHVALAVALAFVADPPHASFPRNGVWIYSDLVAGWLFFTIVHIATTSERVERLSRDHRILRALGSVGVASYSIYLTHEPTLVVAKWIGLRLSHHVLFILATRFTLAMVVGYAFHYLVERRFIQASRPEKPATAAS